MLKILVINEVNPDIKNRTSLLFDQIVPELSKKQKVEIFWISHYDKMKVNEKSNYNILNLRDYKNAKEIIEKIRPTFVYVNPNLSLIEDSFLITAKTMNVPTVEFATVGDYFFEFDFNLRRYTFDRLKQFFQRNSHQENKKSQFKGIMYIKKILFFVNSQRALEKNIINAFLDVYRHLTKLQLHKYNCDLIFVENEISLNKFVKWGVSKERLFLTGDPVYDRPFAEQIYTHTKKNEKKRVLFLTVNLRSVQKTNDLSFSNRNKMIKELISQYKIFQNKYSLSIKIHPVSENLSEYKKMVGSFKKEIRIYQKENIYELIRNSDIILTSSTSTAGIIVLIMKKPIIVWNYFDIKNDLFINNKVVLECKNPVEIEKLLDISSEFLKEKNSEITNFTEKYFGTGNSIQKIVNVIENKFTSNIK